MTQHTTSQILEAVSEKIASGHGFKRHGKTDHFDSTVTLDATQYRVKVEWPDGAEKHGLSPEIETV
jgi:hypothetical protein